MHRQVVVIKTIGLKLQQVLNEIIKIVTYVKTKVIKWKIFAKFCEEMGAQYTSLILLTKIRWLLKDRVLVCFFE